MIRTEILQKVKELVAGQVYCEDRVIEEESILKDDIGLDSLDTLELGIIFEEKFHVDISEEELAKFKIIKYIVNYIEKAGK